MYLLSGSPNIFSLLLLRRMLTKLKWFLVSSILISGFAIGIDIGPSGTCAEKDKAESLLNVKIRFKV